MRDLVAQHFFEQASAVMAASGRSVPVFIDKYLAASWEDARWMYDRAKQLQIPFMAGSSVPMCFWRNTLDGRGYPEAEHPLGVELEDAVLLSYGGLEAYGYHGLGACSIAACMQHACSRQATSSYSSAARCPWGRFYNSKSLWLTQPTTRGDLSALR